MSKPKIHLDPVHCGQEGRTGLVTTTIRSEVTCRGCLRRIPRLEQAERVHHIGDTADGVPVVRVFPEGWFRYAPGRDGKRLAGTHLAFTCWKCGARLSHGGLHGQPGAGDGHRASHCDCWRPTGYYLREALP